MTDTLELRETKAPSVPSIARVEPEAAAGAPAPGPAHSPDGALEPTLYRFIFHHSLKRQLLIVGVTLASFPAYYFSLDLPKTIVNKAIGGKNFPQTFLGFQFSQISYLMILCAAFLALVFINGGFKYVINVLK